MTGSNLILGPEGSLLLANQNFLSPDSVCYSFDHRANGYARGEGIIALILKPISSALRDGDMIRAVIRSIGSNQDGRTPGLVQPSTESQESLIRHVYQKANLGFESTRYVEAHGLSPGSKQALSPANKCYRYRNPVRRSHRNEGYRESIPKFSFCRRTSLCVSSPLEDGFFLLRSYYFNKSSVLHPHGLIKSLGGRSNQI